MTRLFILIFLLIAGILPEILKAHIPENNLFQFLENKGQWDSRIKFKSSIPGGNLYLENGRITYNLFDQKLLQDLHERKIKKTDDLNLNLHCLQIDFLNASNTVSITGEKPFTEYFNFYTGRDQSKWASDVHAYGKINYNGIYPGIDLDVYTKNNSLKYDFVVAPHTLSKQIQLLYKGAKELFIRNGNLVVKTSLGDIIEKKPYSYQVISGKLQVVACEFLLKDSTVSFSFPKGYNTNYALTIDPELIFSTYSGSLADNFGYTATFDSEGFLYSAGSVFNVGYVTTPGALQTRFGGGDQLYAQDFLLTNGTDVGITKYDTSGKYRIYSTYLGGSGSELPHSLVVDKNDELLVFGTTSSKDFPMKNPLDNSFDGGDPVFFYGIDIIYWNGTDIFVSKIDSSGKSLINSTYIGGKKNDGLNTQADDARNPNFLYPLTYNYADEVRGEIDIDQDNNIYISTCTNSIDFPITTNSFQPTAGGGGLDACIIKLSANMEKILWGSYLGGTKSDAAYSIAIDKNNDIYVSGGTDSPDFPVSDQVLYPDFRGGRADGFITHISKDGSKILKSTYYGYLNYDQIYFVELSTAGDVFVFGQTEKAGNAFIYNSFYNKPDGGQFISKIHPSLDSLIWSTSFGTGSGYPDISPTAFLVDLCSKIYLSGWGGEVNVKYTDAVDPITFQDTTSNNAGYVTGLDITSDAYQTSTDGSDFYLMVLADDASQLVYGSFFGGPETFEHVDGGTSRFDRKGKIYQSVCAGCGGIRRGFPIKPDDAVSPTNNSRNCNNAVFKFDFKLPIVVADFKMSGCNPIQFSNKSLVQQHTSFLWNFGDNTTSTDANPTHTYTSSGTFKITLTLFDNFTCNLSDSIVKEIYISPLSLGISATASPTTIYKNNSSQLQAFPITGYSYSWSPSSTLNNSAISNPVATPKDTTTYTVTITDPKNKCAFDAAVTINVIDVICGEPYIYIPNAFTPNNDGKNEELYVRGEVLQDMNLIIYDRWGEKVFETTDQKAGWNGYFRNMKVDPGVFVYYLEATCVNQEKFFKKGNITLIR